jgi:hypothetical protein
MEQIFEPNTSFPFDQLVLTNPTFVNSGNYFIKYLINGSPLYIQPPKAVTKQGFIKGGKKIFCDLLFTNEDESFIRWIEDLENYSQKYIFNHRSKWFETELEMHDIESSFTSPLKIYKSGKFYIARTHIPTRLGKCTLRIFDEQEQELPMESILDGTSVMTIWEIQGIKCSTRSFQIDIEVKQMLVLPKSNLFDRCIITKPRRMVGDEGDGMAGAGMMGAGVGMANAPPLEELVPEPPASLELAIIPPSSPEIDLPTETPLSNHGLAVGGEVEGSDEMEEGLDEMEELDEGSEDGERNPLVIGGDIPLELDEDPYLEGKVGGPREPEMEVVDFHPEDIQDPIDFQLKNRNDVYYEMYTSAKKKAEEARNLAISAYLEAKRIKELYMIQEPLDIFTMGPTTREGPGGEVGGVGPEGGGS